MKTASPENNVIEYPDRHRSFRGLASVCLSGVIGALIGAPISATFHANGQATQGTLILCACVAFGLIGGYRRRTSVSYFYFCLVIVVVLATVITISGFKPIN